MLNSWTHPLEGEGGPQLVVLCDLCTPGGGNKELGGSINEGMSDSVKGEDMLPGEVTAELGFEG